MPPPVGGWNTRDDIGVMPPTDAEVLDNWIPEGAYLRPRKGHKKVVTASFIDTFGPLFYWGSQDALVCPYISSDNPGDLQLNTFGQYDGGDFQSGCGHDLPSALFEDFEGRGIIAAPGDTPIVLTPTEEGGDYYYGIRKASFPGAPVSDASLRGVKAFKNRLYYWSDSYSGFVYTELYAFEGTLTAFPLNIRGKVLKIDSWTVDGGDGSDDFLAIFTDTGQVVVYQGTDPGSDFQLVGTYQIPRPVSARGITQYFGKLFVVTAQDYLVIPDALVSKGVATNSKLSGAARDSVRQYGSLDNWQAFYSPSEGLLGVNVPTGNLSSVQHCRNLRASGAFRMTGLNATSWADFRDELYFTDFDGNIFKYVGKSDPDLSLTTEVKTGASDLGAPMEKWVTAYRFRIQSDGWLDVASSLYFDFGGKEFEQEIRDGEAGVTWGSPWGFEWPVEKEQRADWLASTGRGSYVSLGMRTRVDGRDVRWTGYEYLIQPSSDFR